MQKNNAQKAFIVEPLYCLASRKHQIRYIDNSTIDEYATPGELVEYVYNPLEIAQRPEYKFLFTETELKAIAEYKEIIDYFYSKYDYDEIYDNMPEIWKKIMEKSLRLLNILGFTLDDFYERGDLKSKTNETHIPIKGNPNAN
mgnify:FL=1